MSRGGFRFVPGRWLAAGVALAAFVLVVHSFGSAASAALPASFTVGAGSSFSLGSATFDLGCGSLVVAGTFGVGSGTVEQALDVIIASGGTLNGETGTLNLTGHWDNGAGGSFNAGTGTVQFGDGCGISPGMVTGSTTFSTLTFTTATGKGYQFEAGSTQTIGVSLTWLGAAGNRLVLLSTSTGSEAILNLQGTATVDFVDLQDIHAIPNPFTLGPNSVVGTNTAGLSLCGDIDGNFLIETADVTLARQHLMGQAIAGVIRRCNVVGLFDPSEAGEDCDVVDIYTLTRLVAGANVLTDANACKP